MDELRVCPHCEALTEQDKTHQKEEYVIHGETFTANSAILKCRECGNETDENDEGLLDAYRQYRDKKGMVQPDELVKYRYHNNLDRPSFAKLLKLEEGVVARYEEGALQTLEHDKILRSVISSS